MVEFTGIPGRLFIIAVVIQFSEKIQINIPHKPDPVHKPAGGG